MNLTIKIDNEKAYDVLKVGSIVSPLMLDSCAFEVTGYKVGARNEFRVTLKHLFGFKYQKSVLETSKFVIIGEENGTKDTYLGYKKRV